MDSVDSGSSVGDGEVGVSTSVGGSTGSVGASGADVLQEAKPTMRINAIKKKTGLCPGKMEILPHILQ